MNELRVLIVDDEPLIRTGIRRALAQDASLITAGECECGAEAIRAIRELHPDLVLLDIRMPDFSGIEVVRQVGPERMPPVIFITAYDDYAVRAFEVNAIDYVLKPFDQERLLAGVERARKRIRSDSHASLLEGMQALLRQETAKWPERIAVRVRDGHEILPVQSIDWAEAADNYVQLRCGSKTYLLNETMNHLEQRLNPASFLRVHRRYIVNIAKVTTVSAMGSGSYELRMRCGTTLSTGRQYRDAVMELLDGSV